MGGARDTCVLRLRYNMTTTDYVGHPYEDPDNFTDWRFNDDASPVQNDPNVDMGISRSVRLALDTSQTGRTFQDRSHIFKIVERPVGVSAGARIWNLNVRGKRGNIVQVYPGVEYDFTPNTLEMSSSDYVHIQWTGSNPNPNGNDGQGTAGTDRSNIVQIEDLIATSPSRPPIRPCSARSASPSTLPPSAATAPSPPTRPRAPPWTRSSTTARPRTTVASCV